MEQAKAGIAFFERLGFRVIYMQQDDFYMLVPSDDDRRKYGVVTMSTQTMTNAGKEILSISHA